VLAERGIKPHINLKPMLAPGGFFSHQGESYETYHDIRNSRIIGNGDFIRRY
jgi:hypothetical protein